MDDQAAGLDRRRLDWLLLGALVLWMLYSVNGFRPPTQPIVLSDSNSGGAIRQLVFTLAFLLGVRRLVLSRSISRVLGMRAVDLCLVLLLLGSVLWSASPNLTIKRGLVFLFGTTALLTIVHQSQSPVRLMLRTITHFTGLVAWASLLVHVTLPASCSVNPARPGLAGISNHPNTLAPFLAIGLVLSLGLTERGRWRRALWFSRSGQAVALLLTTSISTFNLTLVSLALYVLLVRGNYLRSIALMATAAFLLVVTLLGWQDTVDAVLGAFGRDTKFSGRDELWARIWEQIVAHPLLGHGYGAFWYEGRGRELVGTWNPRQAHNAYLDVLTDLGILGLSMVLFAFHGRLYASWCRSSGGRGTDQRRAVASLLAASLGILLTYSLAQSFVFKLDSFPFFVLYWSLLLMTNLGGNRIEAEYRRALPASA